MGSGQYSSSNLEEVRTAKAIASKHWPGNGRDKGIRPAFLEIDTSAWRVTCHLPQNSLAAVGVPTITKDVLLFAWNALWLGFLGFISLQLIKHTVIEGKVVVERSCGAVQVSVGVNVDGAPCFQNAVLERVLI